MVVYQTFMLLVGPPAQVYTTIAGCARGAADDCPAERVGFEPTGLFALRLSKAAP